ncbi:deoxynucleoside triphosphate triphosphohydrolase SAMHD1-like [Mercenaria mercenaria]|uniref:deoxynucleoside triphosphate triphosphohydrolase SAMHD1-like n=1 Tax=Mercenaria mercenaria TaxID=6596 RepID=UPI00234F940E|nr:deoxynucleoside triphosphate triphosphohydrolase SAMHD1-like [Mercenaria mercenaria]
MPPTKAPKYGHLFIAVQRCGLRITKELFLKRVRDITPEGHDPFPWTVDDFLYTNREKIIKHKLGEKLKQYLFPGHSKSTNLERLDLNTFCFLLIHFCGLEIRVRQDINRLRKLRNKLVHLGDGDIDEYTYETDLDRIRGIISRCSNELNNPELAVELENVIKEIENVQLADFEKAREKLKEWMVDETKYRVWIKFTQEGFDGLKTALQDVQERLEENGKLGHIDISFSSAILFIELGKELEEAFSGAYQGSVPGKLHTHIQSCVDAIKEDIRQMGPEVESVSIGSIIFKFTCFSVTSLIYLVDYFSGPILQRRLHGIAKALQDMVDDLVTIQICVPPENSQEIIQKLEKVCVSEDDVIPQAKRKKVFNDPLYGQIELHPLCVKIIDTPQFQRLRHIKQLETCYLVYPGASHNRFEHSIGVCHLAGKFLRVLKELQPELDITTKDILCVEIAALCHDLGQGPFSHVFEHKFIPTVFPDSKWKHEMATVKMFEYMLRDNEGKLREYFRQMIPGFEESDIEFIKELIGVPADLDAQVWPYRGRNKNKSFLYEVVANGVNGIDVDRWDYLARDSLMMGMKTTFRYSRLIQHAKVLVAEGRKQICYREKAAETLYDMFYSRMTLYKTAYQHKTHNIIGLMIRDALLAANRKITFASEKGEELPISDTIHDMKAYTHLTDDILQQIQRSTSDDLKTSREILDRIIHREFYKCIIQTQIDVEQKGWIQKKDVQKTLFDKINQKRKQIDPTDSSKILEIDVVNLDYGFKDNDPVTKVWFFKKGQEDTPIRIDKEQVSFVLPDTFAEQYVRVYSSVTDSHLFDIIEQSFSEWCDENDIPQPKGLSIPKDDSPK